ncbi:bifunctional diaminohydroxyphosphoribosylaminopyrimidine deaminase/5-amino-6-(5-phosphoribosylamino)uracil reductase RibD [Pseudemcibacter aquimaris]|uniref:bifunctional diaminohydroxyphosphoribosylaminopyrimidine deaminase/5-amino-6-(5-phosphoribosylamino)uracil reductase RibD n=1 Tax=Pseudemcibacter aquimaris TaxID=2857064 RepID=UPI002010EF5C|nr:bifunctional diaminohydroxyphosphoribosylaminopyrimidine deaminase/5-amino-6-(5-phosphoribosylamino)uracil reductase RibD [Pseudemcibacter aquimaris]MCC3860603.1 bifunctional diaminohydroxyphosphoribosylaminopyrimidine deaminase/5-amino-6-(5-phosphoribosylamino)uracil reductase RibD [Pseudemcibacter aquimaris]WDU59424.1 bifunctional diaminohydroxyphosphoribosylaminopyrimidine deaminase/5-amino-6-(5-phosphoribosylamino)uracil reductase RibD [Pseudemcibacter aquimaris]
MKNSNPDFNQQDHYFMGLALNLARRGIGRVAPNPSVGCVLVRSGHIIGRGWTADGGRPHAETIAIKNAGDASGATAYVTLEPCAHYGETPPCAEAMVKAGVAKVVIATGDPDERVAGKGIDILKKAGVDVSTGLMKEEADQINQGFFKKVTVQQPLVTVKLATSSDGKIAKVEGEQYWVTGQEARARGHLYRVSHDAIMVGINTVLADDPSLDCRLSGLNGHSPIRIILDSELKLPVVSKLSQSAQDIPVWVMTVSNDQEKISTLEELGVKIFQIQKNDQNQPDISEVLRVLAQNGITRLLSEGGAKVNASLVKNGLVDRIIWFKSAESIGENGVNALYDIPIDEIDQYLDLSLIENGVAGADHWQEFMVKR